MLVLFSRSRGQGQGRYNIRCEKMQTSYFRNYNVSEVETLYVCRRGRLMHLLFAWSSEQDEVHNRVKYKNYKIPYWKYARSEVNTLHD